MWYCHCLEIIKDSQERCERDRRIIAIFPVPSSPGVVLLFIEIIKNPTCPPSRVCLPLFSLQVQINRVASLIFTGKHPNSGLVTSGQKFRQQEVRLRHRIYFLFFHPQLFLENSSLFSIQVAYFILYTAVKAFLPCINSI